LVRADGHIFPVYRNIELSKIDYLLSYLSLSSPIGSEGNNLRIERPRPEITNSVVEGRLL
jgi:hypothetical protein